MWFFRNRLAFGAFFALVFAGMKIGFDIAYKVLKVLKLQLLFAVLFVGIVLYLTNVLFNPENKAVTYIWIAFLALGFFYAVIGNTNRIKKLFSGYEKKRKEKLQRLAEQEENEEKQKVVEEKIELERLINEKEQQIIVSKENLSKVKEKYPKYYRVSQNKDYVMAEYKDRYELYVRRNGKLFKVRTDRKKESV